MSRPKTRDRILQTARRLFYVRGFDRTSLADIAAASDVPKGNFYYHFKSKDDVLRAVITARRIDVESMLSEWVSESATSRLERVITMVAEDPEVLRYGCPTGSLLVELGKTHLDLRPEAATVLDAFVRFCSAAFVDLGVPERHASAYGFRLLARLQGAILVAQGLDEPDRLSTELHDIRKWVHDLS